MTRPPEVDSPDLNDEEIAVAISTGSPEDMAKQLNELICPACGERVIVQEWCKRQRIPHIYSRLTLACSNGHRTTKLYQMTWSRYFK